MITFKPALNDHFLVSEQVFSKLNATKSESDHFNIFLLSFHERFKALIDLERDCC